ncbi:MAG: hypothetical protein M3R01_10615 [Actinomycetota bacterium]|nr:hypothetical protein [Actinomycetota bacterium]
MASDEQFREPENSTVDDWLGQNVARDEEVADQAMSEAGGDEAEAERIYEERATGEDKYEAGRPD